MARWIRLSKLPSQSTTNRVAYATKTPGLSVLGNKSLQPWRRQGWLSLWAEKEGLFWVSHRGLEITCPFPGSPPRPSFYACLRVPIPLLTVVPGTLGGFALLQDDLALSGHTVCCCYLLTESCQTLSQPHGLQPPSSPVRDFS